MPVSKKRKKDGKPVHRQAPPAPEGEQPVHAEVHEHGKQRGGGKPKNPFVAAQPQHRGSQRGR